MYSSALYVNGYQSALPVPLGGVLGVPIDAVAVKNRQNSRNLEQQIDINPQW